MRQAVLDQPGRIVVGAAAEPQAGPGEALVRVRRVGICGTDLHAYRGHQPFFNYPRVLGHELAVEVLEIGANPAGIAPGDQCVLMPYLACGRCVACRQGKSNCCTSLRLFGVHVDGGMQEYMAVPVEDLLRPAGLSLDQMALVENQSIGAHAVRRAQLAPGEYALVIGAGPIGLGCIQFAQVAGAQVIALDIDPAKLAFCQDRLGVQHVVDARGDVAAALERITGGDYPTAVFDATGNAPSMMRAFSYVAHGGRLVLVSLVQGEISFHDPEFHKRELTLMSSRNATQADFAQVIACMQAGTVASAELIGDRVALEDLPGAFERWTSPGGAVIKALVEI